MTVSMGGEGIGTTRRIVTGGMMAGAWGTTTLGTGCTPGSGGATICSIGISCWEGGWRGG